LTLLAYWCCTSFIPVTADYLASIDPSIASADLAKTKANYVALATTMFNIGNKADFKQLILIGGLLGTFAVIPVAGLGRRKMYLIFFASGSLAIFFSFSPLIPFSPYQRLFAMILVGFTIFGLFSTFPFYLPELYPTEYR
jgi:MFS family permease